MAKKLNTGKAENTVNTNGENGMLHRNPYRKPIPIWPNHELGEDLWKHPPSEPVRRYTIKRAKAKYASSTNYDDATIRFLTLLGKRTRILYRDPSERYVKGYSEDLYRKENTRVFWYRNFAEHIEFIQKKMTTHDIIFCPQALARNTSGKEEDLMELRAVVVDLDFKHLNRRPVPEEINALLELYGLPPFTFIVDSGNGFHCYYVFERKIKKDGKYAGTITINATREIPTERIKRAKEVHRRIHSTLREILKSYSPDVNSSGMMQNFRLPGSINHKYGTVVSVVSESSTYNIWDILYRITKVKFEKEREENIVPVRRLFAHAKADRNAVKFFLQGRFVEGFRNSALFATTVIMQHMFPCDWEERVRKWAKKALVPNLTESEIDATLRCMGRKRYYLDPDKLTGIRNRKGYSLTRKQAVSLLAALQEERRHKYDGPAVNAMKILPHIEQKITIRKAAKKVGITKKQAENALKFLVLMGFLKALKRMHVKTGKKLEVFSTNRRKRLEYAINEMIRELKMDSEIENYLIELWAYNFPNKAADALNE